MWNLMLTSTTVCSNTVSRDGRKCRNWPIRSRASIPLQLEMEKPFSQ